MSSLENRNSSALFKRAEQLKRWQESNTNHEPTEPKRKEPRIQFTDGCVFLAACAASDKDEVEKLIKRGADIDTANIDGLTALHQVGRFICWHFVFVVYLDIPYNFDTLIFNFEILQNLCEKNSWKYSGQKWTVIASQIDLTRYFSRSQDCQYCAVIGNGGHWTLRFWKIKVSRKCKVQIFFCVLDLYFYRRFIHAQKFPEFFVDFH